jgi:hypothetical protein
VVQSMSMQDYGHVRQLLLLLPQLRIWACAHVSRVDFCSYCLVYQYPSWLPLSWPHPCD